MTINKIHRDKKLTVFADGRVDSTTAPELENALKDLSAETNELIFDFKGLYYISSAGLRVLLSAQKRMNKQGTMKLINVGESVMEILDITGFNEILTIE